MMCYQISESGEPVALVADFNLAQAIIQCQPPGHYMVNEVEVGDPAAGGRSRARRRSSARPGHRGRHRQMKQRPARWSYRPVTLATYQTRHQID
jgi:hypothetical protein